MIQFLKYLDARLSEASTYAGISAMLLALNIHLPDGWLHLMTTWGVIGAGAAAVLLADWGSKPPAQIASDVMAELVGAIKMMPTPVSDVTSQPVGTTTTTTVEVSKP